MASLSDLMTGQAPVGQPLPHRSRVQVLLLATVLGAGLICGLALVAANADYASRPTVVGPLQAEDLDRLDAGIIDIDLAGFITADAAREAVRGDSWINGEPSVPRASIVRFPETSIHMLRNRAVWILRYAIQDETTPAGIPIPYVYFIVDARDGYVYGSQMSP
jgi:hypothetical protein